MKKLIALVVAAFALAGCSNFVTDFGIPSVRFSSTGSDSTTGYKVFFDIQPYPGSPSGQILSITVTGPAISTLNVPGVSVPECLPSTPPDDCPKIGKTLSFQNDPGPLSITSYVAQSLNGATRTITLPVPVPINP